MSNINFKNLSEKIYKFFQEIKSLDIKKALNNSNSFLNIEFEELSSFDLGICDSLLESPNDTLKVMEEVLKEFFIEDGKKLAPRLTTLPESEKILIRDIRTDHLGKLVWIEGQVRRKTDVRPRLKEIHYLCTNPSCNFYEDKIRVPQLEEKMKQLKHCPKCKSQISIVKQMMVDSQTLVLEEIAEQMKNQGDQAKRMNILLEEDLVSPFKDGKTNPGSRLKTIGIVREVPKITKTGAESVNFDLIVLGSSVSPLEDDYSEIKVSKEDLEKIKEIANSKNPVGKLVENFAKSIYGNNLIKEAIILQMFGGSGNIKGDGIKVRGDMHILLIGEPGAAKSQLLKAASKVAPRSSFVSGKSASGVGLTATVVRDEIAGGWALEAGSLVLASGGLCAIDEMDKMNEDDVSAMHEALEQQTISIAKANIRATLRSETSVLGAANPKYGRFDEFKNIAEQLDFPPALLSRFDLLFIVRDKPNKKKDRAIATHILESHRNMELTTAELDTQFFKKYISYAKPLKPKLTQKAIDLIRDTYVSIRVSADDEKGKSKRVPITARQLEAILRLSEAYAKIELKEEVEESHAKKGIALLLECLSGVGIDPKTGKMDSDVISLGTTSSKRNEFSIISQIVNLLSKNENELISLPRIIELCAKEGVAENVTKNTIQKMKENGELFEPKKGLYKKLL